MEETKENRSVTETMMSKREIKEVKEQWHRAREVVQGLRSWEDL